MRSVFTQVSQHINAPRARVYAALLDADLLPRWKVPAGMTCRVHAFEAREGGSFRISLTYDDRSADARGKTTARTDSYHGRFLQLVPDQRIAQLVEFETADPDLRGQMSITTTLTDAPTGGTELVALHDRLPRGLDPAHNEAGWRQALAKLAALLEQSPAPDDRT